MWCFVKELLWDESKIVGLLDVCYLGDECDDFDDSIKWDVVFDIILVVFNSVL